MMPEWKAARLLGPNFAEKGLSEIAPSKRWNALLLIGICTEIRAVPKWAGLSLVTFQKARNNLGNLLSCQCVSILLGCEKPDDAGGDSQHSPFFGH